MSKVAAFVQLDLLTLQPYYKSVFALLATGSVFGIVQRDAYAMATICLIYALLLVAYPFTIGDKYALDVLYGTLAIRRSTVVYGRYALVVLLYAAVAVCTVALTYGMALLLRFPFSWPAMTMLVAVFFLFFALAAGLQLPIFFKLGYTKAKLITYIPLVLVPLVLYLFSAFTDFTGVKELSDQVVLWVENQRVLTYGLLLTAGLLVLVSSAWLSRRLYEQREF